MKSIARIIFYFLIINLIIIIIRIMHPNTISMDVIFDSEDFVQLFIKKDGEYTEKNSFRSSLIKEGNLTFKLPFGGLEDNIIRIDPGNKSQQVLIENIIVEGLFYSKYFRYADIKANIKVIQMIDEININNNIIKLNSSGNDAIMELQNVSIDAIQNNIQIVLSFAISVILFVILTKFTPATNNLKLHFLSYISTLKNYKYLIITIFTTIISLIVIFIFYPGFMTYDTLHAIRGARNGVIDSMWPPMVSYVWRFVDYFSTNPALMHFLQVFILIFSTGCIIYFFTKKIFLVFLILIIFLFLPSIIGTIAAIWKDVLMSSFYMCAFFLILLLKDNKISKRYVIVFCVILLIFMAICTRHNAIVAAVPLLIYLAFNLLKIYNYKINRLIISSIVLGLLLSFAMYYIKGQLDRYSLPTFKEIKASDSKFIEYVKVLDLAGASICLDKNLFYEIQPNLTIENIRNYYDPRHINLSKEILNKILPDERINDIWLNTLRNHPICFLKNKFEMTTYMIGLNSGQQFLITDPNIIENEFGYVLKESKIRNIYVKYIQGASSILIFKPWFIYLISVFLILYVAMLKKVKIEYIVLTISGIFYFLGLVLFGNAADARLLFYTNVISIIIVVVCINEIIEHRKRNKL